MEEEIDSLADQLDFDFSQKLGLPWRFMLVKALEDDPYVIEEIGRRDAEAVHWVRNSQKILAQSHGRPPETVISSERHALSVNIFEHVAVVKPAAKPDWRERLDKIATDRFWGYVLLVAVLTALFPGGLPVRPVHRKLPDGLSEPRPRSWARPGWGSKP